MPDTYRPLPLPIIVGVSGHCDLDLKSPEINLVRLAVREILLGLKRDFTESVHVLTALAAGADQLVAEEADALGIPLLTALPMPRDIYLLDMPDDARATFERLWDKSKLEMTLPYLAPVPERTELDFCPRHYRQLAAFLARRSHLLLVLWDGLDDPTAARATPKPGGTADAVRLFTDMGYAAEVERHSPLFAHNGSPLDALRTGTVLCVSTPRQHGTALLRPGSGSSVQAGSCFMLRIDSNPGMVSSNCKWVSIDSPRKVMESVEGITKRDFGRLGELNAQLLGIRSHELKVFKDQFGYLDTRNVKDQRIDDLKRFQAGTDTAARHYQGLLIGSFSASTLGSLPGKIYGAWKDALHFRGPAPWPNVLTIYGVLLPLFVILFELYSKLELSPLFLVAYFLLSAAAFGFYKVWIGGMRWQDQWQDYRALAEALRVQLYWSISGLPLAAGDNYLRKQDTELGWIKFALQGPALWAAAYSLSTVVPNRGAVLAGWIDDQAEWFIGRSRKAQLNEAAAKRNDHFAKGAYFLGLFVVAVLLVDHGLEYIGVSDANCVFGGFIKLLEFAHVKKVLDIVAVTMPAIAAYLTLMTNLRAYDAHARSYWQMGTAFRRAHTIAKSIPESSDPSDPHTSAFKSLVRELGRESLAETAEWLMDHRDRRVEPPS
jgi:hypothetical protein